MILVPNLFKGNNAKAGARSKEDLLLVLVALGHQWTNVFARLGEDREYAILRGVGLVRVTQILVLARR